MNFEPFQLERQQSIWENKVDYNLSESGVHPGTLKSLFSSNFIEKIENTELTYGFTEGSPELRRSIASIYPGATPDNVQAFNGSGLSLLFIPVLPLTMSRPSTVLLKPIWSPLCPC